MATLASLTPSPGAVGNCQQLVDLTKEALHLAGEKRRLEADLARVTQARLANKRARAALKRRVVTRAFVLAESDTEPEAEADDSGQADEDEQPLVSVTELRLPVRCGDSCGTAVLDLAHKCVREVRIAPDAGGEPLAPWRFERAAQYARRRPWRQSIECSVAANGRWEALGQVLDQLGFE